MAAINQRGWRMGFLPVLVALTACAADNRPLQVADGDAGAGRVPARAVANGDAAGVVHVRENKDGSLSLRKAQVDAVALRRTGEGAVEIRKAEPAATGAGLATPVRAEPLR